MMEKRVGIYTKVYRNEPTIHRAVQSVLSQTYQNFKYYVLVSDATREILAEYAARDGRIELISGKPEDGILTYIKQIAGDANDYITVLDADDWYAPEYLAELVAYAEQYQLDITACGNYFVDEAGKEISERVIQDMLWKTEHTIQVLPYMYGFYRTIWGKLITSAVLLNCDFSEFPSADTYGGYGGDTLFMFSLLPETEKIGIVGKILYYYRLAETGNSQASFKAGRLDADTVVFDYVKSILNKIGRVGEEQERFLYLIYGEALQDTTKLIKKQTVSDEKKAELLLQLYQNERTGQLIEREYRKMLDISAVVEDTVYVEKLYGLLFDDVKKCTASTNSLTIYCKLFEILYPQWKGFFTAEEFCVLLKKKEILDALTQEKYQTMFSALLNVLNELNDQETEICLALLRRIVTLSMLKPLLEEKSFVLSYADLLEKVNAGEVQEAFAVLRTLFSAEQLPYGAELLLGLWSNLAAFKENTEEFILSREIWVETLWSEGKYAEAESAYEELEQFGVVDDAMIYLQTLIGHGSVK